MAEESSSGVRSSRRWAYIVGFLVVGYPLSTGPAYRLCFEYGLPPRQVMWLYDPLDWLAGQSDFLGDLFSWYLFFWLPPGMPLV